MIRLYLIKYLSGVRLVLRGVHTHIQFQDEAARQGKWGGGVVGGGSSGK